MTYKNIVILSVLALAVLIPVTGANKVWAHHVNYMDQMVLIDKELEVLYSDNEVLKSDIQELQKTSSAQDARSNAIIQKLQQQLNAKTDRMIELDEEFRRLEQLNMDSYRVDSATEKRFYAAEDAINERYLDKNSVKYVGDNPVTFVTVDFQHKAMVVMFDPDQVTNPNLAADKTPATILKDIRTIIGQDVPINIEYGKPQLVLCSSRTSVCDPLIGGIQVADTTNPGGAGTEGYKSSVGTESGFVTAGHVSGPIGKIVEQPLNNRDVGTVTKYCRSTADNGDTCDFSFVDLYSGISISSSSIFWTSSANWVITNKVADSSQTVGTTVKKSGVGTGNTIGTITDNNPSKKYTVAQITVGSGDSGSPIFRQPSDLQNYVDLYGIVYKKAGSYALYYPWDYIKTTLGLNE